jgi:chemotaxis receptor (MCP) glutamine deamidase CheD
MIEQITGIGANIDTLQAQIYGGGSVITGLDDIFNIGMENVRIAREKLYGYGIPIICEHIRARHGIRVVFKTSTGEVKITPLGELAGHVSKAETAAVQKQLRLCKKCIMCGSCAELLERKRREK